MTERDMELYRTKMQEIRRRIELIRAVRSGALTFGDIAPDEEFCCLQLRKVLELIALALLVAHKGQHKLRPDVARGEARPNAIFDLLQTWNADFYPYPTTRLVDAETGRLLTTEPVKEPYLDRKNFLLLYRELGALLHAENPYGRSHRWLSVRKRFNGWTNRVITLLQHHELQLSKTHRFFVSMEDGHGRVHSAMCELRDTTSEEYERLANAVRLARAKKRSMWLVSRADVAMQLTWLRHFALRAVSFASRSIQWYMARLRAACGRLYARFVQDSPTPSVKDVQQYCACMEEVKKRLDVVGKILRKEVTTGYTITDVEAACLHTRKILELIAFAAITSNRPLYALQNREFWRDWDAKKIFRDVERLNPDAYPIPIEVEAVLDAEGGTIRGVTFPRIESLSRGSFDRLYTRCANTLHILPLGVRKDAREVRKLIGTWHDRVVRLLNYHQVGLASPKYKLWVLLKEIRWDRVHASVMKVPLDPLDYNAYQTMFVVTEDGIVPPQRLNTPAQEIGTTATGAPKL